MNILLFPPRKLTEAELDKAIERSRESHDEAMRALAPIRRPRVIRLDGSWLARLMRWVRNLRFGGRL